MFNTAYNPKAVFYLSCIIRFGCPFAVTACIAMSEFPNVCKYSSTQTICPQLGKRGLEIFLHTALLKTSALIKNIHNFLGVSNCWIGIWNGTVEWKMEWNGECTQL